MLAARVRADLAVYEETIIRDAGGHKDAHRAHQYVARARLAFQGARNTLAMHVASHEVAAATSDPHPPQPSGSQQAQTPTTA
jgi:hypothetical protein